RRSHGVNILIKSNFNTVPSIICKNIDYRSAPAHEASTMTNANKTTPNFQFCLSFNKGIISATSKKTTAGNLFSWAPIWMPYKKQAKIGISMDCAHQFEASHTGDGVYMKQFMRRWRIIGKNKACRGNEDGKAGRPISKFDELIKGQHVFVYPFS